MADFLAPAYGPGGGLKLSDTGDGQHALFTSGAGALRASGLRSPELAPYVSLAAGLQAAAGDQATGGTLFAARLVILGLRLEEDGVARASTLDGLRLARRQVLATLRSLESPDPGARSLRTACCDPSWADLVWSGLPSLRTEGAVRLDDVEVVASATASEAAWLRGLVVEPKPRSVAGTVGVGLLEHPPRVKPRSEMGLRVGDPAILTRFLAHERAALRAQAEHLRTLSVHLLACPGAIPESLLGVLHDAGIQTLSDLPLPALRRMARATGATAAARIATLAGRDIGAGVLERDGRRWLLAGKGPAATFEVPAATAAHVTDAKEQADRLLRVAGLLANTPRALPGGGRWQREASRSLRAAADAAPGKAPLVLRAVSDAFAGLADDLVRNLGLDPWRTSLHPQADDAWDVAPAVRLAVEGAFEAATQVLRIDARHAKRSSSAVGLRGAGTPTRIRSGDVPPLM